nr:hypothetical protein [Morchella crassipes]
MQGGGGVGGGCKGGERKGGVLRLELILKMQHPSPPPSMTFLPLIALRAINDPPSPPSDSRNRTGGEGGGPEERGEPNSCKQLPLDPVLAPPSFYLSSKDKRRSACLRGAASTLVFFIL